MFRFIFIVLISLMSFGCIRWDLKHSDREYLTEVQSIHPIIVPPGVSMPVSQPLYLVPNLPAHEDNPVSLVPPGSHLNKAKINKKNS